MTGPALAVTALVAVLLMMGAELLISRRNERRLLARGAIQPPDPVYGTMRWAYPAVFVAMAVEGALTGGAPALMALGGAVLFAAAKVLKFWAIASLGTRWTFRVLVLAGVPLVGTGPYRFMRHPNYVAVLGELVGMALLTGARAAGPIGTLLFAYLMYRRVAAEERALGDASRVEPDSHRTGFS